MTNSNMQRLTVVLACVFALLLGILVATTLFGGNGGSSKPTAAPSSSLAASLAPSPGASGEPPESAAPSESASASPSASPSPSPTPIPAATIQFVQLALDGASDSSGEDRTIAFTAQAGTVTVKLKTESGGNSKACLFADGKQLACRTAVSGTLTGTSTKKTSSYKVTLRGSGASAPVVDVTVTFPAQKPKVTIDNARFDGTSNEKYNGLQVVATPRAKGYFHVTANWGGHPFLYELNLIEQGGPGLKTVKPDTGATKADQGFNVAPPNAWMIVVKNTEDGFGVTGLTAVFTWP
ncbi:MAG: hypothetical protein U0838_15590 [Chloroflexota bacterium]